jgi:hypothetical protein
MILQPLGAPSDISGVSGSALNLFDNFDDCFVVDASRLDLASSTSCDDHLRHQRSYSRRVFRLLSFSNVALCCGLLILSSAVTEFYGRPALAVFVSGRRCHHRRCSSRKPAEEAESKSGPHIGGLRCVRRWGGHSSQFK